MTCKSLAGEIVRKLFSLFIVGHTTMLIDLVRARSKYNIKVFKPQVHGFASRLSSSRSRSRCLDRNLASRCFDIDLNI